jgi:hypothetical protein
MGVRIWIYLVGIRQGIFVIITHLLFLLLAQPEIVQRLREIGFYTTGAGTSEETGEFIRAQFEAWGHVVKAIGIQPE